jgi:hypothetical protein
VTTPPPPPPCNNRSVSLEYVSEPATTVDTSESVSPCRS